MIVQIHANISATTNCKFRHHGSRRNHILPFVGFRFVGGGIGENLLPSSALCTRPTVLRHRSNPAIFPVRHRRIQSRTVFRWQNSVLTRSPRRIACRCSPLRRLNQDCVFRLPSPHTNPLPASVCGLTEQTVRSAQIVESGNRQYKTSFCFMAGLGMIRPRTNS